MPENNRCPECGAALSADAPGALCAACLLAEVIGPDAAAPPTPAAGGATSAPRRIRYFGDYELIEEIGRGGMGVVHKARQVSLNRLVALKMIQSGAEASEIEVKRFRMEAEAAAQLQHPQIVPIHEVGEHERQHFFGMKLLEGGTLAARLKQSVLNPHAAAGLVAGVARAVHFAHQHGVLHRDLKPSNILFDAEGVAHVSDFGLAKILKRDSSLTLAREQLGTPGYMAPEQAAGDAKQATTAADVYSLGAILYELLAGRPPFQAETAAATMHKVLHEEPTRPSMVRPGVERDLEIICLKCLEKEPRRRYGSAEALAEDLERWQRREPILARPASRSERSLKWIQRHPAKAALALVSGIAVLALAAATVVVANSSRHARRQSARAEASLLQVTGTLSRLEFQLAQEALAADNTPAGLARLARALRYEPANMLAAERLISALTYRGYPAPGPWSITHTGGEAFVEFSPDGGRLVLASGNSVQVADATSGRLVELNLPTNMVRRSPRATDHAIAVTNLEPQLVNVYHAHWTPGGRSVFAAVGSGVCFWDSRDGRLLAPSLAHNQPVRAARFDAAGKLVITASADRTARVWNPSTWEPVGKPLEHRASVREAWLIDEGRKALTVSDYPDDNAASDRSRNRSSKSPGHFRAVVTVWNVATGEPEGSPYESDFEVNMVELSSTEARLLLVSSAATNAVALVWNVATRQAGPLIRHRHLIPDAHFSPDGARVLTVSLDRTARLWDAGTGEPITEPIRHEFALYLAAYSPDGMRFVTAGDENMVKVWDGLTGRAVSEPLRHPARIHSVVFAPDGLQVLTVAEDKQVRSWDLRETRAQPLLFDALAVSPNNISPDATLFAQRAGSNVRLRSTETRETRHTLVHPAAVRGMAFSPDGVRLATACRDHTVWLWETGTGRLVAGPFTHERPVAGLFPDAQGKHLVTLAGEVRIWDLATRHATVVEPAPFIPQSMSRRETFDFDGRTRSMEYFGRASWLQRDPIYADPAGRWLAVRAHETGGRSEEVLKIIDLSNGHVTATISNAQQSACAAFNPRRQEFAIGTNNNAAVWRGGDGTVVRSLAHENNVRAVAFSPDGTLLGTGSEDNTARLWETARSQPLRHLLRHPEKVWSAAFSPVGAHFATGCDDAAARLWETVGAQDLGEPLWHDAPVMWLRFSANGRKLITASGEATVDAPGQKPPADTLRIWDLPSPDGPAPLWVSELAEAVAGQRLTAESSFDPLPSGTIAPLRALLASRTDSSFYTQWGRWFLADPRTRNISPFVALSVSGFVERCLADGSAQGAETVLRLVPTNALAAAQLAVHRIETEPISERDRAESAFLMRRALALAPGEPAVWSAQARVLLASGRWEEASEALKRAGSAPRVGIRFWNQLGERLFLAERNNDALAAFQHAIDLAGSGEAGPTGGESAARRNRLTVLRQIGRSAESAADNVWLLGITARDAAATPGLVDLSAHYTAALRMGHPGTRVPVPSGLVSVNSYRPDGALWTKRRYGSGESDTASPRMTSISVGRFVPLQNLPAGLTTLAGTPFDVRGLVYLEGAGRSTRAAVATAVRGISITNSCQKLHFLHATAHESSAPGRIIGRYVVHFADGQTTDLPLRYGGNIRPWVTLDAGDSVADATVAWSEELPWGEDESFTSAFLTAEFRVGDFTQETPLKLGKPRARLYRWTWSNPRPTVPIATVDVLGGDSSAGLVLVAITAE